MWQGLVHLKTLKLHNCHEVPPAPAPPYARPVPPCAAQPLLCVCALLPWPPMQSLCHCIIRRQAHPVPATHHCCAPHNTAVYCTALHCCAPHSTAAVWFAPHTTAQMLHAMPHNGRTCLTPARQLPDICWIPDQHLPTNCRPSPQHGHCTWPVGLWIAVQADP
jgi:hypothetical protein